ncbi:MAG TPA: hypothetical protein VJK54_09110 [Chthoniobacterales bacterium]|nr:hypothetical protein [Chthoniobacterales bacterium]
MKEGAAEKELEQAKVAEAKVVQENEVFLTQQAKEKEDFLTKEKIRIEREISDQKYATGLLARELAVFEADKKVKTAAIAQAQILALGQTRLAELKAIEERETIVAGEKTTIAVQTSVQGQQMILAKKREGEAVFARARAAKSESGWNEAQATAMVISNYWNDVVESIKVERNSLAVSHEEATFQRDYWMEKAGIAEVKELEAKPFDIDNWKVQRDRMDQMMAIIRNKVWPIVAQAMKSFIVYPSEIKMRNISASASAARYASISVSAPASACEPASDSASAYASASAFASDFSFNYYVACSGDCRSTFISPYAYNSAYVSAVLNLFSASAAEVGNTEKIFGIIEANNKVVLKVLDEYPTDYTVDKINNIVWSIQAARETADFAHAVIAFKREQETVLTGDGRGKIADGRSHEEVLLEQNRRIEEEKFLEIKALTEKICEYDGYFSGQKENSCAQDKRVKQLIMMHKKFGSPVSPAMKEFIAHPNEVTLKATGKSSMIAMTADEAEEALETAEIFAKMPADRAKQLRERNIINTDNKENLDCSETDYQEYLEWSETITREVVEFARAVATFKAAQEAAKQP